MPQWDIGEVIELKCPWVSSGLKTVMIASDIEQVASFKFSGSCKLYKVCLLNSKKGCKQVNNSFGNAGSDEWKLTLTRI